MKNVTMIFVIPDEDEESLDLDIRNSGLLNNWPCWVWSVEPATEEMQDWYKKYREGEA